MGLVGNTGPSFTQGTRKCVITRYTPSYIPLMSSVDACRGLGARCGKRGGERRSRMRAYARGRPPPPPPLRRTRPLPDYVYT